MGYPKMHCFGSFLTRIFVPGLLPWNALLSRLCLVRFVCLLTLALVVLGCQAKNYPPVSPTAKEIKSGVSLDEIKNQLGEPHPPTAAQTKHLANMISNMPEPMRSNAQKDKSLAWGNDSAFFVVKVNDQGIAWVTTWRE